MKHFVVYHNPDIIGYPASQIDELAIRTDKHSSDIRGNKIWLLTGEGSPRKFYLVSWFIADSVISSGDPKFKTRIAGDKGHIFRPMIQLNQQEWFKDFKRTQGNFAFGLQRITNRRFIEGLEQITKIGSSRLRISPSRFRRAFDRFQMIHVREDGAALSQFSDRNSFVFRTEGYKNAIPERAMVVLDSNRWRKAQIGTGEILPRVISAIELPRNNLLSWQPKYGPGSSVHQPLLEAQKARAKRIELERIFYHLYHLDHFDEQTFEELVEYIGKRYELLAYLFFIAKPDKFLPIRTTYFDRAFEELGVDLRTEHNCSWRNYQDFVSVLSEIRDRLHAEGISDATLLDAHSFCWILAGHQIGRKQRIRGTSDLRLWKGTFRLAVTDAPFTPNDDAMMRDLKRDAERRVASGEVAEELAKEAEIRRLKKAGRDHLAANVEIVSDRPGLGYDIQSFESDGRSRFIEVKNISNGHRFFLSDPEWKNSRSRNNYWFYLVNEGANKRPSVTCVEAKRLGRKHLQPVQYLVRF